MVTRLARVGKELAALRAIAMFFGGQEVMQLTIYVYIYIFIYVQYILFIPFHCVPLCCMVVHDLHTSDISIYIILYLYLNLYLFLYPSIFIYIYISAACVSVSCHLDGDPHRSPAVGH